MNCTRIQSGAVEPLTIFALTSAGAPATGLSTLVVRVRRDSDGFYLDWNDDTFKASGWTTLDGALTEVDATNAAGLYSRDLDTSAITNKAADDIYTVIPDQTSGNTRLPAPAQLYEGDYVDNLDAAVSAVEADTQDIQTRLPAALVGGRMDSDVGNMQTDSVTAAALATSAVDEIADGVWDEPLAGHLTAGSTGEALNDASSGATPGAIADAVWDEATAGHVAAGSFGLELQNKAEPGDAMDLVAGAVDAAAIDTNAIDADSLATSAVNEIRDSIISDATPFPGANIDAAISSRSDFDETVNPVELLDSGGTAGTSAAELVTDIGADLSATHGAGAWDGASSDWTPTEREQIRHRLAIDGTQAVPVTTTGTLEDIEADTQDIQSRLPAALVGGRMDSDVGNMQNDVITASAIAPAAIGPSEIANDAIGAAQIATGAIGSAELATSAAQKIRDEILSDSTPFAGANIDAAISSRSDFDETINPVELLDSGGAAGTSAAELVTDIGADLSATHGAGAWDGSTSDWTPTEREQIRFRLAMDGTQTDPATGAGTLEDILADTAAIDSRLPSDPADESLQQASHTATQAAISSLNDLSQADVQAAMTSQGYTSARAPNLDNLDATVSSRESESSAASRAATNQTEHDTTQTAIGLLETEASASSRAATAVAERASLASQNTAIEADTQDIQSRLPAALVGGRMDSDVGNVQADAIGAGAIAADAIGASEFAQSAADKIAASVDVADECHFSASYIDTASAEVIRIKAWATRGATPSNSPTALALTILNPDGTTFASFTDASPEVTGPDANGAYLLQTTAGALALTSNQPYTVLLAITDAAGTLTTARGLPTF